MEKLIYTVIKNRNQYNKYCNRAEELLDSNTASKAKQDELELLTVLIEKYDEEHSTLDAEADPIELLKSFMEDAGMKAVEMVSLLDVSKGLVSDILNYKKGLSKEIIRKLAEHFKVRQELFNKPYALELPVKKSLRVAGGIIAKSDSSVKLAQNKLQTQVRNYKIAGEGRFQLAKEPKGKYAVRSGKKVKG